MKFLRGKLLTIIATGLVIGSMALWLWFIWNVCDLMRRQANNDLLQTKNDLIRAENELLRSKIEATKGK